MKRHRNPNYSNYLFGTDKMLTKNVIEQINPETKQKQFIYLRQLLINTFSEESNNGR